MEAFLQIFFIEIDAKERSFKHDLRVALLSRAAIDKSSVPVARSRASPTLIFPEAHPCSKNRTRYLNGASYADLARVLDHARIGGCDE